MKNYEEIKATHKDAWNLLLEARWRIEAIYDLVEELHDECTVEDQTEENLYNALDALQDALNSAYSAQEKLDYTIELIDE